MKIGPVYPEVIGLQAIIKKAINFRSKTYSPVGTHAERAKLVQVIFVKYVPLFC